MKRIVFILSFSLYANSLYSMSDSSNSASNLQTLPEEVTLQIVESTINKSRLQQALDVLRALAQTNKHFAYFLAQPENKKKLATLLLNKLGTVAQKEQIAQALGSTEYKPCVVTEKKPGNALEQFTYRILNALKPHVYFLAGHYNRELMYAIDDANIARVKMALKNGADINVCLLDKHFNQSPPLLQAILNLRSLATGYYKVRRNTRHFKMRKADVPEEAYDTDSSHAAQVTMQRYYEIIRILLNAGALVDAQDRRGRTALHWAADDLSIPAIKLLLEAQASTDIKDKKGFTAVDLARQSDSWADAKKTNDKKACIIQLFNDHSAHKKNKKIEALAAILKTKQRHQPENNYIQHMPNDVLRIIARDVCHDPAT